MRLLNSVYPVQTTHLCTAPWYKTTPEVYAHISIALGTLRLTMISTSPTADVSSHDRFDHVAKLEAGARTYAHNTAIRDIQARRCHDARTRPAAAGYCTSTGPEAVSRIPPVARIRRYMSPWKTCA